MCILGGIRFYYNDINYSLIHRIYSFFNCLRQGRKFRETTTSRITDNLLFRQKFIKIWI